MENKAMIQEMMETVTEGRRFQQEQRDIFPLTVQMIDILIEDLEIALGKQHANAMLEICRGLKELLQAPRQTERVNGKVQIVRAFTFDEAASQCPWAKHIQPAGKLKHQQGKWICFETDADVAAYPSL